MKLSHKNRARHDRRIVARRENVGSFEQTFANVQRLFGRAGTEVKIIPNGSVPSRYHGTKAEVIRLIRPAGNLAIRFVLDLEVEVQVKRRKSPLVVQLCDLEYPVSGQDVFISSADALEILNATPPHDELAVA